jgi:signal transduction histidine kinase
MVNYSRHAHPAREVVLVLFLALGLTAVAWALSESQARRLAESRFHGESREMVGELVNHLEDYGELLQVVGALVETVPSVDRQTWREYLEKLHLSESHPGVTSVGYAKRATPTQLAELVASVRAEGFTDFTVTPPGERDDYYPIVFVDPFNGRNQRTLGFDPYSDPARRSAMESARDNGQTQATGLLRLRSEKAHEPDDGVVLYLPIFSSPRPPQDLDARRQSLRGYVYCALRLSNLVSSIMAQRAGKLVDVSIHAGTTSDADSLIYTSLPAGSRPPRFHESQPIEVYGTTWTLDLDSSRGFEATIDDRLPSVVLGAGLLVSILLALVVGSLTSIRQRADDLAQLNEALEAARAEADQANEAKSRFLAVASHDLRQPLQSLGLYLHLLASKLQTDEQRSLAGHVVDGLATAERLLNSLMDTSVLESGQVQPSLTAVNLRDLVERIVVESRPEADAKGLRLKLWATEGMVESDPVLVERMVRNLVANALRYTAQGGILVALRARDADYRIEVWDTGQGIPDDKLGVIFEDFTQLNNPQRDRRKGLGLGLATVSRLARLLGYRLEVCSRLGRGSVFRLELPKVSPANGG